MPVESRLNLNQTFEAQKTLINNTIVPTVIQALDTNIFPVSEQIIYDLIHNRHKHQREEFIKKQQSVSLQQQQARRKHLNSRRNDVNTLLIHFN
jgi:hypothetical protein